MEQIVLNVYLFLELLHIIFFIDKLETYCKYKFWGEFVRMKADTTTAWQAQKCVILWQIMYISGHDKDQIYCLCLFWFWQL